MGASYLSLMLKDSPISLALLVIGDHRSTAERRPYIPRFCVKMTGRGMGERKG